MREATADVVGQEKPFILQWTDKFGLEEAEQKSQVM